MSSRALVCTLVLALLLGCASGVGGDAPGPGGQGAVHVPAWELPPPPAEDRRVVDPASLVRRTLGNGLEVLILTDRRLPRFSMGVTARRGAASEPGDQAGLAAFTAELMERGAGERSALELAGVVDGLGARLGASAGWDSSEASVGGLSRDLDTLYGVLLDVVLRPRFDADEVARVRTERLGALERAKDDPKTLARWAFYRALYGDHRFGLPVEGDATSVAALDGEAARAFHASVFTPANTIFWAVGDVDPDALLARVEASLGDWKGAPARPEGTAPPKVTPTERRVVVVDRPDLGQAQILLGHEGTRRADPRRTTVQLLNTVLGRGGFSSRLMTVVRADAGLTYGIGSSFGERRQPGPFAVGTFTRVPEVRRVVDLVLGELDRMRTEPPDAEELGKAQSLRSGSFGLALETADAVTGALVSFDAYGLPRDSLDTYRARIRATTPDDVAQAAVELLHPERAAIVVVGPAAEIVPLLEDLGPVEVQAP